MAAKKTSPEMAFVMDYLQKNRTATFAEIRDAGAKKKLKLYPIVYGRAQALLGIVKLSPRGSGKAAKAAKAAKSAKAPKAAKAAVGGKKRGRPRKNAGPSVDTSSLEGIIAAVKTLQDERERLHGTLGKIQAILSEVL
ncbi:MAG: hypothetical protein RIT25_1196 [Planctomycetota bacterium]|jgi:hypothetical protein